MAREKPLMKFVEESIKPDFSNLIQLKFSEESNRISEDLYDVICAAYREGMSDGLKLAVWLYD